MQHGEHLNTVFAVGHFDVGEPRLGWALFFEITENYSTTHRDWRVHSELCLNVATSWFATFESQCQLIKITTQVAKYTHLTQSLAADNILPLVESSYIHLLPTLKRSR